MRFALGNIEQIDIEDRLLSDDSLQHESLDQTDFNELTLHINMVGVSLPEGECEDFVNYYTPVIQEYIIRGNNPKDLKLIWNHPFESNMLFSCNSFQFVPEVITILRTSSILFLRYVSYFL